MTTSENTPTQGNDPGNTGLDAHEASRRPDSGEQDTEAADAGDDQDSQGDDTGDTGDGAAAKARREAASYRNKLRDAESKLAAAEQSVIDHALDVAGLDSRLWKAAEPDIDALRDGSGVLSIGAVVDHARQLHRELLGGPRPNPQQGNPSRARGGLMASVFEPH